MDVGYELIPFGERSKRFDCVFVWIYARNCTPYSNYPYNDIPNVSLVLSELRFDGLMGAVGGGVEQDDISLEDAVRREAWEEIHYNLDISNLKQLATIRSPNGTHNHSFSYEVSYEKLQEIRNNAHLGEHFSAENAGVNLMHICRYTKGRGNECGYNNLLTQNFVGTAAMELDMLVSEEKLLINYVDK